MSFSKRNNFTFSVMIHLYFMPFSCLKLWLAFLKLQWVREVKGNLLFGLQTLVETLPALSQFNNVLDASFSNKDFTKLKYVPFICNVPKIFNHKKYWILSNSFSASIKMILWLLTVFTHPLWKCFITYTCLIIFFLENQNLLQWPHLLRYLGWYYHYHSLSHWFIFLVA